MFLQYYLRISSKFVRSVLITVSAVGAIKRSKRIRRAEEVVKKKNMAAMPKSADKQNKR